MGVPVCVQPGGQAATAAGGAVSPGGSVPVTGREPGPREFAPPGPAAGKGCPSASSRAAPAGCRPEALLLGGGCGSSGRAHARRAGGSRFNLQHFKNNQINNPNYFSLKKLI